jgi:protein-S-isoprenylcysteine O-methyltransferase Ste14
MGYMSDQSTRAGSAARSLPDPLPELDSKIIGLIICASAAYDWIVLYRELGQVVLSYRFGIYALPSLGVLSIFFSATFLTCAGIILLLLKRPVSRYKTAVPNLVSIVAAFATYLFVFAPKGNLLQVSAFFSYALIVAGSFVMLTSLLVLRRAFSVTPQARHLVTTGPYSIVRHPMYIGGIAVSLGLALLVDSPQAVGLFIIGGCLQIWRARYEERLLEVSFPQYSQYKKRVGRFIPRLRLCNAKRNSEAVVERSEPSPATRTAP